MITIERNAENIYTTEAWDVYDGTRFLGTAIWSNGGWKVVLRGSHTPESFFSYRQAAVDYIVAAAR